MFCRYGILATEKLNLVVCQYGIAARCIKMQEADRVQHVGFANIAYWQITESTLGKLRSLPIWHIGKHNSKTHETANLNGVLCAIPCALTKTSKSDHKPKI